MKQIISNTLLSQKSGPTVYSSQARPAPTGPDLRLTAIRSPDLPFNGRNLVIHVITFITIHLPTLEGWKAELANGFR